MRLWPVGVLASAALISGAAVLARPSAQEGANPVDTVSAEEIGKLAAGRTLDGLLRTLPCGKQAIPTLSRGPANAPSTPGTLTCIQPSDPRMVDILGEHDRVRAQFGSQRLVWDPALAAAAQSYAVTLARSGRLAHSPREGRGNSRENLSMGMIGWNGRQLVGNWTREQRHFRPGIYPNISATGRWDDVSHYTQMVWPMTVTLGCGMADGSGYRWLVCRYAPGGNRDGVPLGIQRPSRP